jgi:hypothetical protein
MYKPSGVADEWAHTDLWYSAADIPGVTVVSDENGAEARCFSQETSGAAVLYDDKGRLLFTGGITASRGHWGDNDGLTAIVALLRGEGSDLKVTPVFGCSLIDDQSSCKDGESLCGR